jgi:hypothetical protein
MNVQDEPILQFFEYKHLPNHMQVVSAKFQDLTGWLVNAVPRNPERAA